MTRSTASRVERRLERKGPRMKVDLNALIMDIDGEKPLKTVADDQEEGEKQKLVDLTLRIAIRNALGRPVAGDEKITEEAKHKLWRLVKRTRGDTATFDAKDTTLILERVCKAWPSSIVYGQVKDLLDPEEEEQQPAKANGAADPASAVN